MVKVLSLFSISQTPNLPPTYDIVKENPPGLCNQLFHVINMLCDCFPNENEIFLYLFCTDIDKGTYINFSSVLNISKMREKYGWKLYDVSEVIDYDINKYYVYPLDYVFFAHDKAYSCFSDSAKKLIFNHRFEDFSKYAIKHFNLENTEINLVHLRIDKDMEKHIVNKYSQETFNNIVENYKQTIYDSCDKNVPLILLLEDIHHPLVKELQQFYKVIFFEKQDIISFWQEKYNETLSGRELFALVDLLIGKNLKINNYICLDNEKIQSSFSLLLKELLTYNNIYSV